MALSAGLLTAGGYRFLAILIPRVVHDVTGWMFYPTQDRNRNLEATRNALYRVLAPSHLPIAVTVPALAIGVNVTLDLIPGRVSRAPAQRREGRTMTAGLVSATLTDRRQGGSPI
jgi:hypothetical protein